jgi:hypothetical protein
MTKEISDYKNNAVNLIRTYDQCQVLKTKGYDVPHCMKCVISDLSRGGPPSVSDRWLARLQNRYGITEQQRGQNGPAGNPCLIYQSIYVTQLYRHNYIIQFNFLTDRVSLESGTSYRVCRLLVCRVVASYINVTSMKYSDLIVIIRAGHSGRAVCGMNCLRLLKHWDLGFESHLTHECLCAFILCLCCPLYR